MDRHSAATNHRVRGRHHVSHHQLRFRRPYSKLHFKCFRVTSNSHFHMIISHMIDSVESSSRRCLYRVQTVPLHSLALMKSGTFSIFAKISRVYSLRKFANFSLATARFVDTTLSPRFFCAAPFFRRFSAVSAKKKQEEAEKNLC